MTNGHTGSLPLAVHPSITEDSLEKSAAIEEEPVAHEIAPVASNGERCTTAALEETDPVIDPIIEDELKHPAEVDSGRLEASPTPCPVSNDENAQFIGDTTNAESFETSLSSPHPLITEEINVKLIDNEPTSDLEQISESSEDLLPTFTSNDENQVLTSDDENIPPPAEPTSDANEIPFEAETCSAVAPEDIPQEKATPLLNGFHHEVESAPIESEGRSLTPPIDKDDEKTLIIDIELPIENPIPSNSCEKVEASATVSEEPTPAGASSQGTEPTITTAAVSEPSVPLVETLVSSVQANPLVSDDDHEQNHADIVSSHQHEQSEPWVVEEEKLSEASSNVVPENPNNTPQPLPVVDSTSTHIESSPPTAVVDNHASLPIASTDSSKHLLTEPNSAAHAVIPTSVPFNEKIHPNTAELDQPTKATPVVNSSKRIEEDQPCAIPKEPTASVSKQALQTSRFVEPAASATNEPVHSANRTVPSSTTTTTKNESRRANHPSKQASASPAKQAYSTVVKKTGPTATTVNAPVQPVQRATEERTQVLPPPLPVVTEPKTPRVSMEQRVHTVHVVAEPIVPVAPVEEVKKSSTRNKKSRRGHAKNQQTKNSVVKPMQVPQIVVSDEGEEEKVESLRRAPPIIVLEPPVEHLSTEPQTSEPTPM